MSHFIQIPPVESNSGERHGAWRLLSEGFNIPVIITSVPFNKENLLTKNKLVLAHFDTGATKTCIDETLADELDLIPVGEVTIQTAAGFKNFNKYIVDIIFPNTDLKGYRVNASSCNLPYKPELNINPKNFGVLLGRDIMANWNIVWNGPNSTIIISD